jgi:hypothetical protein
MKIISNLFVWFFFLSSLQCACAQYKVTFLVKQPPALHKADRVFIAGNFNTWNPGDPEFGMDTLKNVIATLLPKGTYQYKFTRGNWQKRNSSQIQHYSYTRLLMKMRNIMKKHGENISPAFMNRS